MYEFEQFRMDIAERTLLRNGEPIPLLPKSFDVLAALVQNSGKLLSKDFLLRTVWADAMVEENSLARAITDIRRALGEGPKENRFVATIARRGYRFIPKVKDFADQSAAAPIESELVIPPPQVRQEKSLAVLYFANLSGDKEDEYFRDGMTEDIITEIAKIKELQVFPRSAVLPFRDHPLPVPQASMQLAPAYILDGSIRRDGDRLRITTQLAETRSGHSVWAERYDRELRDVFVIQDEIAKSIAHALHLILTEDEWRDIERVPTPEVQAYDCYLRGRQFFYQLRRKGFEFARQMFSRAIVIDAGYARAYAGLADSCAYLYMWFGASSEHLREAAVSSRRAVELDLESAEAHASRGLAESLSKNFEAAEREFEISIRLNPQIFEAHYFYGSMCFAQGQYEKAAALFTKASLANPGDYQANAMRAGCLRALGHEEEARQARRDSLQMAERHLLLNPDDVRAVYFGANALCELGERTRALEWCDRALSLDGEEASVLYNVSCVYALLGETDKSLSCLEKAFSKGFGYKVWIENDPDFVSLRSNPRFEALMQGLSVDRKKSAL